MKLEKIFLMVALLAAMFNSSVLNAAEEKAPPTLKKPDIVPSPMLMVMEPGYMPITETTQIIFPTKELEPLAKIFAEELKLVTGLSLKIVGRKKADKGDIEMSIAPRGKEEAYLVKVGDHTYMRAKTYQGMAYATTTLLQALTKAKDGWVLPKMQIADEPGKAYRGVLIDVARRMNSPRALRHVIQMARYYKIRYMVLHLSDDHAWTFPSTEFPKLGSRNRGFRGPAPRVYTKQELLDLVKFADERGVTLVPEIDTPGHSGQMRETYPEVFGFYEDGVSKPLYVVDIASPKVYEGMKTLIDEACEIFKSSPYIHIGNDEAAVGSVTRETEHYKDFLKKANAKNAYELHTFYAVQLDKYVKANGKRSIMWGDGAKNHGDIKLPDDIIRMVWIDRGWSTKYLEQMSCDVITASWTPLYQVNQTWERLENNLKARKQSDVPFRGEGPCYDYYIPEEIFNWNPYVFGGEKRVVKLPSSQIIGSQLTVWEQGGEVQFAGLRLPMATYSERAWNIGSSQSFEQYEKRMMKTDKRLGILMKPLTPFKVGELDAVRLEKTLTRDKPVTASGPESGPHMPKKAVDGILDTYWDANPYPQWLQVDLEKPVEIDEIRLYGYIDGSRYYQYTIKASLDGENWETVVDASKSTDVATSEGYRHKIKPIKARYVKVNMLKNSANPGVHIRELSVYEAGTPRE
jgi:hexosaminidase